MKLLAVFLACLITAGYASAGGLSVDERTQNHRIGKLERRAWADEVRIRVLELCDRTDEACALAVQESMEMQQEQQ